MRPLLQAGQLLFSKSAKVRDAKGTEITFTNADKKDYISVLLGSCPKGKEPNEKQVAGLLGKIGLVSFDEVERILGKKQCDKLVDEWEKK